MTNPTPRKHCFYIVSLCILTTLALALTPAPSIASKHGAAKKVAPDNVPLMKGAKLVRDDWYTVTISGKIHYGFYNERVELRNEGTQIYLKSEYWKQEESYINREDVGVVATNNELLSPLFFNFHSMYRTTETSIDGTVKDGKFLTVRAKRGGQELPIVQRSLPSTVFFSALFPVWLGKLLPSLKQGATKSFSVVMEDNLDLAFMPVEGTIKLEAPDDFAIAHGVKKIRVDSRGMRTWWWVDDQGTALKLDVPEQHVNVVRTPKAEAKKFLDGAL